MDYTCSQGKGTRSVGLEKRPGVEWARRSNEETRKEGSLGYDRIKMTLLKGISVNPKEDDPLVRDLLRSKHKEDDPLARDLPQSRHKRKMTLL